MVWRARASGRLPGPDSPPPGACLEQVLTRGMRQLPGRTLLAAILGACVVAAWRRAVRRRGAGDRRARGARPPAGGRLPGLPRGGRGGHRLVPVGSRQRRLRHRRRGFALPRTARLRVALGRRRGQRLRGDGGGLARRSHRHPRRGRDRHRRGRGGDRLPVHDPAASRRRRDRRADRPRRRQRDAGLYLGALDPPERLDGHRGSDREHVHARGRGHGHVPAGDGVLPRRARRGQGGRVDVAGGDGEPAERPAGDDERLVGEPLPRADARVQRGGPPLRRRLRQGRRHDDRDLDGGVGRAGWRSTAYRSPAVPPRR